MIDLGPCLCPDFKENVPILNAPFTLAAARNPETYRGYTGKQFKFCPWCGETLKLLVIVTPETYDVWTTENENAAISR